MQRMMSQVLVAGAVAGGLALAPTASRAQGSSYQNQPTATGNAYLNENDFDYNREHMTPPDRPPPPPPAPANRYNQNGYGQNDYNRGYPPPRPPRANDYGQYRDNRSGYDDRSSYERGYQDGLAQRRYNAQQNYRSYQNYNDDQD